MKTPLTALSCARKFFQNAERAGKKFVTNVALFQYVAERTGQTRAVLNGTLDGTGPGKLITAKWYKDRWHKIKDGNGRIIHQFGKVTVQREMNFDSDSKRESNRHIMSYLPVDGSPRILTLASSQGYCVKAALARNPNVVVDNIECDDEFLRLWKIEQRQLSIRTNDFGTTLQRFVCLPYFQGSRYALINADVMGYASRGMLEYLSVFNKLQNAKYIAVTTQKLTGFRNGGEFVRALRTRYAGHPDAHVQCIRDWLSSYTLTDRFTYTKAAGTKQMEVLIFKLAV